MGSIRSDPAMLHAKTFFLATYFRPHNLQNFFFHLIRLHNTKLIGSTISFSLRIWISFPG